MENRLSTRWPKTVIGLRRFEMNRRPKAETLRFEFTHKKAVMDLTVNSSNALLPFKMT